MQRKELTPGRSFPRSAEEHQWHARNVSCSSAYVTPVRQQQQHQCISI